MSRNDVPPALVQGIATAPYAIVIRMGNLPSTTSILSVRVSPGERAILEPAAEQAHTSLSEFVRRKALELASGSPQPDRRHHSGQALGSLRGLARSTRRDDPGPRGTRAPNTLLGTLIAWRLRRRARLPRMMTAIASIAAWISAANTWFRRHAGQPCKRRSAREHHPHRWRIGTHRRLMSRRARRRSSALSFPRQQRNRPER